MKTKSTLLIAFCLLLFACPPNDDDNNIQTAVLTGTNYVYEGDLYRFALTVETNNLNEQISIWEEQGEENPGDIEGANMRIIEIENILQNTTSSVQIGFPPIPTPPPIPVCFCFDELFRDFNYVVADAAFIGLTALLKNENGEVVFSTDTSSPLNTEGLEGDFKAYKVNRMQENFFGIGTLQITKALGNETVITYEVNVIVNELP